MMWSDEPEVGTSCIFTREGALDVLLIVVCWQVQGVAGRDVIVDQRVVLDDAELLSRVVVLALGVSVELLVRGLLLLFLVIISFAHLL